MPTLYVNVLLLWHWLQFHLSPGPQTSPHIIASWVLTTMCLQCGTSSRSMPVCWFPEHQFKGHWKLEERKAHSCNSCVYSLGLGTIVRTCCGLLRLAYLLNLGYPSKALEVNIWDVPKSTVFLELDFAKLYVKVMAIKIKLSHEKCDANVPTVHLKLVERETQYRCRVIRAVSILAAWVYCLCFKQNVVIYS